MPVKFIAFKTINNMGASQVITINNAGSACK